MKVYEVTRRIEWDMAHRIPGHAGNCRHLHGHRYRAEITCQSAALDDLGFVVDFGVVKRLVGAWVEEYWDHNTCYGADDVWMRRLSTEAVMLWDYGEDGKDRPRPWYALAKAPTAENLAERLYEVATELLIDHGIKVVSVDLWETPNCRAHFENLEMPEPAYNPGVMEPPSFEDPSMFGLKEVLGEKKEED